MNLVTLDKVGRPAVGVMVGDSILDVAAAAPVLPNLGAMPTSDRFERPWSFLSPCDAGPIS